MRGRAYVKSTKLSSSPRLQHVGAHLLSAGLTVVPLAASIVASGLTSYLGGSLTQLRAWERILADRNLAVDGYSLIIEDDISRHPQLSADIVQPALLHAASLSNAAGLPFFYAGVCGIPYLMKRHSFVLHRGPTLPLDVPVRTNLTGLSAPVLMHMQCAVGLCQCCEISVSHACHRVWPWTECSPF